jgi:RNA polymerase sigma-70 factor (ECF subfamily)
MNPPSDAEIVRAVLDGDRNRYSLLVDACGERIINYLARMIGNRYEAEELAQETFVRAYVALNSYNPEYKFSTWLYKIATNLCINYLKKRKRYIHVDDYQDEDDQSPWVLPDPRSEGDPARVTEQRELQEQIQQAINQLPTGYQTVVILRHVHGLSYQEIADVTALPIGTVKSRLGRGRSRLSGLLVGKL